MKVTMRSRNILRRVTPFVGVGLLLCAVARAFNPANAPVGAASPVVYRFPPDAGVLDVTRPPYNARGDGVTDDTTAIQAALDAHPSGNRIIYLPKGTYLVSKTLTWPTGASEGAFMKRTILQGESQNTTVLRLRDKAAGFDDPKNPRPVLYTGRKPAQRFRNSVWSLTVDTGKNNPGAVGIQFIANNQGAIRDVSIRSSDGQGRVGLDLGYTDEIGPCLIVNVMVDGFDTGVHCGFSVDSMTFEHLRLRNQKKCGFRNDGQCVSIRDLHTDEPGGVPSVLNAPGSSLMTLLDSRLSAATPTSGAALENGAALFARNVTTWNYSQAITGQNGTTVFEFVAPRRLSLPPRETNAAPVRSLGLPIRETPHVEWDSPQDWISPTTFGAMGDGKADATPALQKAIDSGKPTVYLPNGTYRVDGILVLRGKVRRFIGCEARFVGKGRVRFDDGNAPIVLMERFDGLPFVENAAQKRTLIIRHCGMAGYETNTPSGKGGDVFLEDVVSGPFHIGRQNVWARQLNIESPTTKITNAGGTLWVLGYKTERGGTLADTTNGGKTEIAGGFAYATSGPKTDPMFRVSGDSHLSATLRESCFNNKPFETLVLLEQSGETRRLMRGDAPLSTGGSLLPLFSTN